MAKDVARLSVYFRNDAIWLCSDVRTTTGLWTLSAEKAVTLGLHASPIELGSAVVEVLSRPAEVIRNPARDEWSEHRRRTLGTLLKQARTRSWRAFEAGSSLVAVRRNGTEYRITSMARMDTRSDAWRPELERSLTLEGPEPVTIGSTLFDLVRR